MKSVKKPVNSTFAGFSYERGRKDKNPSKSHQTQVIHSGNTQKIGLSRNHMAAGQPELLFSIPVKACRIIWKIVAIIIYQCDSFHKVR